MPAVVLETDPVTLARNADGTLNVLALATRGGAFETGLTAVVTGVRERLQLIAGEWFLNLDAGIPYFERDGVEPERVILGERFDEARIREPFLKAILSTPGVVAVTQLAIVFDGETRTVSITWRARCLFGETPPDTLKVTGTLAA